MRLFFARSLVGLAAILATQGSVLAQILPKAKPSSAPEARARSNATTKPKPTAVARPKTPAKRLTVPKPPPPPDFGAVPALFGGEWIVPTRYGILSFNYLTSIKVVKGQLNDIVGETHYFLQPPNREDPASRPTHVCSGIVRLASVGEKKIVLDEQMNSKGMGCPGDKKIELSSYEDRIVVRWMKRKDEKVTMQGWAVRP